ncbi:DNA polymerase III subunit gamma/tau [Candidatus Omnitrophota bacterium]
MAYLVLARKYRPQNFGDLTGQDHITGLLKKGIESGRMAHAYLFSGPRGVGKTSCARILAKSLNCEQGPTLKPCGTCPACREIAAGTSFDVLEIDGASNRGIDEIRALRENVKFAPSYGRYKIYIVDEVHMLTTEAFNALLKTLEEPPEHVKFIFATTAPNKVPATIISRTQRYDFKRISIKTMIETLDDVSKQEKLEIHQDALYAISKAAQGSLRDGLSILDQLSVLTGRQIESNDVFSMLGLVETEYLFELCDALAAKDCATALNVLEGIIDRGKDIKQLAKEILEHFRHLMIIKVGGKALGRLVDYPVAIKEMLLTQTEKFTLKNILDAIDAFIEAQDIARITESIRMPLEVAFAKLTYVSADDRVPAPQAVVQKAPEKPITAKILNNNHGSVDIVGKVDDAPQDQPKAQEQVAVPEEVPVVNAEAVVAKPVAAVEDYQGTDQAVITLALIKSKWDALTHAVSREKMSVAAYLQVGVPLTYKNNVLVVGFPEDCLFNKESLEDQEYIKLVESAFATVLQQKIVVKYIISDNCEVLDEEPLVKKVLDAFDGEVVNRWHNE